MRSVSDVNASRLMFSRMSRRRRQSAGRTPRHLTSLFVYLFDQHVRETSASRYSAATAAGTGCFSSFSRGMISFAKIVMLSTVSL